MPKDERNERNSQNATGESLANCVEPSHFIPFWVQDSDPICKSALNAVAGLGETPEEGVTKKRGTGQEDARQHMCASGELPTANGAHKLYSIR